MGKTAPEVIVLFPLKHCNLQSRYSTHVVKYKTLWQRGEKAIYLKVVEVMGYLNVIRFPHKEKP